MVPMVIKQVLDGFIGLDSVRRARRWTPDELQLLRVLANLIGTALRRDRAEETLNFRTSLLSGLLDSIPDMVFYKDLEGAYINCNRPLAELAGRARDEIVGRTDHDLFPEELAESYRRNDLEAMVAGTVISSEEWVKYPDGRQLLVESYKAPLHSVDGTVLGTVGVSRDITGRHNGTGGAARK